jgi:type I restriction enzyme S subunit
MAMNQSCYGLQGTGAGPYFVYFATRQLVAALKQRSHGSVFDTITRDTLDGVEVVTPSRVELDTYEGFIAPLMERIIYNLKESKTLADLRDTILPKLISGEMRVGDHIREEFT